MKIDSFMSDLERQQTFEFKGDTYEPKRDGKRLAAQLQRVKRLMLDGTWRSLNEIAKVTNDPPASVSARLRDLRREGYTVERKYIERGLNHYRVRI